ncbi:MAG TPA: thiamine phosphate synthase [Ignavibacteria bacterium]|nr:thiamine phosphate synthase [Ignavibacteria bacterium]HMQ98180.1 thiamine phosphate synthase [Ignavibacteria bacterium]
MVITSGKLRGNELVKQITALSAAGVKAVQLREKNIQAGDLLLIAKSAINKIGKSGTKLIANERLDVALLAGANGIHSSSHGIENMYIRKFAPGLLSGRSVHSVHEAVKAEKDGFDYILFGPIFRTPAKVKYGKPQGLKNLAEVCSSVKIPVFAVGGINPKRIKRCINAGAYGVAAIREFADTKNLKKAVKEFMKELGSL